MSAPNHHMREADMVKFGLLASRAIEATEKLTKGSALSDEERDIVKRASDFLQEVANGAELVSKGLYRGHNSMDSMRALDYAMGPLEQLREFVADQEIADVFRQMSETLRENEIKLQQKDFNVIKQIEKFFEALNDSLIQAADKQNPPVGAGRTQKLAGI